jgi:hypothetical protein
MRWLFVFIVLLASRSTVVLYVVDSGGNPVEGAEIYFCARKAVTDAKGIATFTDIPDLSDTPYGGCMLEIHKEGYITVIDAFAVTEDMELTYVLYSEVITTIEGTVYFDRSDNPAPFVAVRVYDAVTGAPVVSVLTDDEGHFSFEISADRNVYIIVSDYENQKFYVRPEHKNVLVIATTGIVSDVDISVRDDKKRPLENVIVRLEAGAVYQGKTDAKGVLVLGDVPTGEYTLTVTKEGYSPVVDTVFVVPPERGGVFTIALTMEKAVGTLTVSVSSGTNPLYAQAVITSGEFVYRATVDGTKTIVIEPGVYTVEVTSPGYESAKRQVIIVENQEKSVQFTLKKLERTVKVKSEPSKDWWLIIVVVVVSIGILLLKKR